MTDAIHAKDKVLRNGLSDPPTYDRGLLIGQSDHYLQLGLLLDKSGSVGTVLHPEPVVRDLRNNR
jgi:hypothetical protein